MDPRTFGFCQAANLQVEVDYGCRLVKFADYHLWGCDYGMQIDTAQPAIYCSHGTVFEVAPDMERFLELYLSDPDELIKRSWPYKGNER